jgi:hypothetical protein
MGKTKPKTRVIPREGSSPQWSADDLKYLTREARAATKDIEKALRLITSELEDYCRQAVQRVLTEALTELDLATADRIQAVERAVSSCEARAVGIDKHSRVLDSKITRMLGEEDPVKLIDQMTVNVANFVLPILTERLDATLKAAREAARAEVAGHRKGKEIKINSIPKLMQLIEREGLEVTRKPNGPNGKNFSGPS